MSENFSRTTGAAPVVVPPAPSTIAMVGRAFAYWLAQYRRTYRGTVFTTFLEPLGFLAAIGLGLGTLVDNGSGPADLAGVGYLAFIAPGLLAATAMQAAAFESTYPVMGSIKWHRTYHAQLATPLRVVDLLAGHLLFVLLRLVISVTVFLGVMAAFGAIGSSWAVLALPVAVLTGMAHATPIFAFAAAQENDAGFAMLFRFGIVPMFLFSGTFFPVSQLPDILQPVAWVTPLWHGVSLCRDLSLGHPHLGSALLHLAVPAVWTVAGFLLARRVFHRRLVT
ncbi:MAG: lipooligosaccharide transport system permease protein [Actinomycetota bacterium]|jgi:lipooligosaccharide transport system permease protein|nr:lipooligosaccharide transport system permease protein [Actinomycetota bacterium]